ncbi:MAG: hypothetical protein ACOCR0_02290 [Haloferacaceae archaeon]
MNRTRVVLAVAALLVVGALVGLAGTDEPPTRNDPPAEQLVVVDDEEGSALWPHTSRARSVDQRTLAINVIAMGDRATVERHLRREGNWSTQPSPALDPENETEIVPGVDEEAIPWRDAHGAARYTYVRPAGEATGTWVEERYQLYESSYLGERRHIRAYESPNAQAEWTAIQAHGEHWDWFRLRHTVTETDDTRRTIERDLMGSSTVERVWRRHLGTEATVDDGWTTIVEFATVVLLVASTSRSVRARSRRQGRTGENVPRHQREDLRTRVLDTGPAALGVTSLIVAIVALYLGVRVGGVAAEETFRSTSPKVIAAALYPFVAVDSRRVRRYSGGDSPSRTRSSPGRSGSRQRFCSTTPTWA